MFSFSMSSRFLDEAIYCGTLVSYLSVRRYGNPINSLNDLLNAVEFEGYSWGTVDETALLELFQVRYERYDYD